MFDQAIPLSVRKVILLLQLFLDDLLFRRQNKEQVTKEQNNGQRLSINPPDQLPKKQA